MSRRFAQRAGARAQDWPIAVRKVDLREPLHSIDDVEQYPRTRVFVEQDGLLVGSTDIANVWRPISETRLRQSIAAALAQPLMRQAIERQLSRGVKQRLPASVSASIVVATCGRPKELRRCLAALKAQASPRAVEIVVVDNRPGQGGTAQVIRELADIVYIEEPRPGLSYARNTGFAAARGDILITVDDDVTVPPGWIERLLAPFARPEVAAVTGHVLPLALDTESQCRFEAYGGLGKGFDFQEANGEWFRSMKGAVPTWRLGATANAAFRASIFLDPSIGLLDEALGAGMPTGCSEDTYLFYRILKAGWTIVYDPGAWVWHLHRSDMKSLKDQIYSYSKGHVAYQVTTLLHDHDLRALVRLGWSLPKAYLRRALERLRGDGDYPIRLILTEVAGNLAGPWALWRARRQVRRLGRSLSYIAPERRAPQPGAGRPQPGADPVAPQRRSETSLPHPAA